MAKKSSNPVGEFFKRSGTSLYAFINDDQHDLVRALEPVVKIGCLKVTALCAYAPDGLVCGYEFQTMGKHIKCEPSFLGCWIDEFDRQKAGRLPVQFTLQSQLKGVLLFGHPYGCTMAVISNPQQSLASLFNAS